MIFFETVQKKDKIVKQVEQRMMLFRLEFDLTVAFHFVVIILLYYIRLEFALTVAFLIVPIRLFNYKTSFEFVFFLRGPKGRNG